MNRILSFIAAVLELALRASLMFAMLIVFICAMLIEAFNDLFDPIIKRYIVWRDRE